MFLNINNCLVLILACSTFVTHNVHGYVSETELVSHHNARRFYFGTYNAAILETSVPYKFLGNQYQRFFINGHGMITLGEEKDCCPHKCNPKSVKAPIIGAYMRMNQQSDDAFNAKVLYQEFTFVETPSEFINIVADINWSFPGYTERPTRMVVVTWRDIPTYGDNLRKHRRNTFQTVLATDDVNSTFVLFYYNRIEWPSFETSRDPVEAGLYGGKSNPSEFYMLPGSCNYSLINIAGMSNIDKPGKFVFKVDSAIEHPNISRKCAPVGNMSTLRISHRRRIWQDVVEARPRVVPSAGVVPVVLSGIPICSDFNVSRIVCTFRDKFFRYELTTEGVEVPGNVAIICHTPKAFRNLGRNELGIKIEFASEDTIYFKSYVIVTDISRSVEKNFGRLNIPSPEGDLFPVELNRTFGALLRKSCPSPVMINASVEVYSETGWEEIYTKAISEDRTENLIELPESIQVSHFSDSVYKRARVKLSSRILLNNFKVLYSEVVYDVEPEYKFYYGENSQKCHTPYEIVTNFRNSYVYCPFDVQQAKTEHTLEDITESKISPIISFVPLAHGSPGYVCIYNRTSGSLQSAIEVNTTRSDLNPNMKYVIWKNYLSGYIRYIYCCQLNNSCPPTFFPLQNAFNFPKPFQITGATHITVTDGVGTSFTIEEEGVFLLFRVDYTWVQIFSESLISDTNNSAAVVRMVVIRHHGHVFQVNVASEGLQVWINNEPVNFYNRSSPLEYINDNFTVYGFDAEPYTIKINGNTAAIFTFENDISLQFTVCEAEDSLNVLGFDRGHFLDHYLSRGILALKPGNLLNTSNVQNEWRVAKKDILQHQGQSFGTFGLISPETPLKIKVLDKTLDSAANMTFCQGSVSCNVEYMLSKNENLAKCTMKFFAERESLHRELHPITSSTTDDLQTTTIQNKAAASTMSTKQYVRTDSSSSEDYDSNEIVLPNIVTPANEEFVIIRSKCNDITTNNGEIQDSTTTKPYNLESAYGFEAKLALWLMGVILVLGVLILAANICLYIGVRRNARIAPDVALNWFVQYRK